MKFLFKNRKNEMLQENQKVASGIAVFISNLQNKWVRAMEKWSGKLSRRGQVVAFSLFLTIGSVYSLYCIITVFMEEPKARLNVEQLRKPLLPDQNRRPLGSIVSERDFLRIQHFKIYIDSLARSPGGQSQRDSLLNAHPGLMDSIARVEEIYRRQHANK